jgi:hypothetical protein
VPSTYNPLQQTSWHTVRFVERFSQMFHRFVQDLLPASPKPAVEHMYNACGRVRPILRCPGSWIHQRSGRAGERVAPKRKVGVVVPAHTRHRFVVHWVSGRRVVDRIFEVAIPLTNHHNINYRGHTRPNMCPSTIHMCPPTLHNVPISTLYGKRPNGP